MASDSDVLTRPWPLTGRHEDLEAATAALGEDCPAFVMVGDAGSGKTRLAREVLRLMAADGWPTAGATATESARTTPFGALAHLIPSDVADAPQTVVQATRAALEARGDGRPVILHVDDAHLLDEVSASLLVGLVESGTIRILLTMRPDGIVPDAISALRAADGARTLVLRALDPIAVDSLLHRVLGAPLDGAAEAQLRQTSGGNPLYLRELVIEAVADGTLTLVSGVWRLSGTLPTSEALGDRVLGRMSSLPEEARAALELIAVGEPIGLDLLETMVDPELLEELEQRALIRVEADQRRQEVRLAHPVYGEILRSSLGRVRLRRLSRLHAERIVALGARRRGDALRVVRWQIDAGISPDADVVSAGARMARHHQDWPTTASLSRAAVDAGAADAAALLAEAHFELGEFEEAERVIDAALADESRLSEEAIAQLHRYRALVLMWGRDDSESALAVLEAVEGRLQDPALRELVVFSRASTLCWGARLDEAMALLEPLLASEVPRIAVQAALGIELLAATAGPTGRAVELADQWFPVHLAMPDLAGTNSPGNHILAKSVALVNAGDLDQATALIELGYGTSVANRSLIGQMWFSLQHGRLALLRGDVVAAARWFREQIALCRGTGHRRPVLLGLCGLASAEGQRGDGASAAAVIAELESSDAADLELFATERAHAQAWTKAANGDPAGARAILLAAAERAESRGVTLMGALARVDALRLGATDQAGPLAAAATTSDSRVVELAAQWAAHPNDADVLRSTAASLEGLGCLGLAAECFAAAGTAAKRAGDPRRAAADEQRAAEMVRGLRGLATPALTTTTSVVPLTAREREIAILAASGLPTKELATRLYLSARTVSNHLQNIYTMLGIARRTELADALTRLGLDEEAGP